MMNYYHTLRFTNHACAVNFLSFAKQRFFFLSLSLASHAYFICEISHNLFAIFPNCGAIFSIYRRECLCIRMYNLYNTSVYSVHITLLPQPRLRIRDCFKFYGDVPRVALESRLVSDDSRARAFTAP